MIYDTILTTIGRSLHDKQWFAFILGYSSLPHAPWCPISKLFKVRFLITYHRAHTRLGLELVLYAFE